MVQNLHPSYFVFPWHIQWPYSQQPDHISIITLELDKIPRKLLNVLKSLDNSKKLNFKSELRIVMAKHPLTKPLEVLKMPPQPAWPILLKASPSVLILIQPRLRRIQTIEIMWRALPWTTRTSNWCKFHTLINRIEYITLLQRISFLNWAPHKNHSSSNRNKIIRKSNLVLRKLYSYKTCKICVQWWKLRAQRIQNKYRLGKEYNHRNPEIKSLLKNQFQTFPNIFGIYAT